MYFGISCCVFLYYVQIFIYIFCCVLYCNWVVVLKLVSLLARVPKVPDWDRHLKTLWIIDQSNVFAIQRLQVTKLGDRHFSTRRYSTLILRTSGKVTPSNKMPLFFRIRETAAHFLLFYSPFRFLSFSTSFYGLFSLILHFSDDFWLGFTSNQLGHIPSGFHFILRSLYRV